MARCGAVGNYFGSKALESKFIKREYIAKTEEFYTKYGGKTGPLGKQALLCYM